MAKIALAPPISTAVFLFLVLLTTAPLPQVAHSLSLSQYKSLISLSHSLLMRVSNVRAARGDVSGSVRARSTAEKLNQLLGLGFVGMAWSVGWDYMKNYAWRELDYGEMSGAVSDVNELLGFVGVSTRTNSNFERASSVARNYGNVVRVSKRLLNRLLKIFGNSGALREIVETVQREVMEGELLKDCLELGSDDLQAILQLLKDFVSPSSQEL